MWKASIILWGEKVEIHLKEIISYAKETDSQMDDIQFINEIQMNIYIWLYECQQNIWQTYYTQ